MTDGEIEQLANWLKFNHDRPFSEVLGAIIKTWPDATAPEIKRSLQRMNEIAGDKCERQSDPIRRRSRFRLVDAEPQGEPV
jgi:hypothetical protein